MTAISTESDLEVIRRVAAYTPWRPNRFDEQDGKQAALGLALQVRR